MSREKEMRNRREKFVKFIKRQKYPCANNLIFLLIYNFCEENYTQLYCLY